MVTRGLKSLIKKTSPGKLGFLKGKRIFRTQDGRPLRGITRRLGKIYSNGTFPSSALSSDYRGGFWNGPDGGRRRGNAVDSQVTRLVNTGLNARRNARMLKLTQLVFQAFEHHSMEPVIAQRVVTHPLYGIATAADVICQKDENTIVLVELKCGYAGDRLAAAYINGHSCFMNTPCKKAKDTTLHRHLLQLSSTLALFERESDTLQKLSSLGITNIEAVLLYVDSNKSELHELTSYWRKRGNRILNQIR
tara:strand:+ start:395 stop:1141 length:747 start_codon:yes stop_codon:yes gene_type:complete